MKLPYLPWHDLIISPPYRATPPYKFAKKALSSHEIPPILYEGRDTMLS